MKVERGVRETLTGATIRSVESVEGCPGGPNNDCLTLCLTSGEVVAVNAYSGGDIRVAVAEHREAPVAGSGLVALEREQLRLANIGLRLIADGQESAKGIAKVTLADMAKVVADLSAPLSVALDDVVRALKAEHEHCLDTKEWTDAEGLERAVDVIETKFGSPEGGDTEHE